MLPTDDGGAAFPRPYSQTPNGDQIWSSEGMSLRDYFAAKAMQGMVASGRYIEMSPAPTRPTLAASSRLAEYAYKQADAMLAARGVK